MPSSLRLSNNAIGKLASSLSNAATSLTLATGEGARFPSLSAGQFYPATISRSSDGAVEIVKVTARSSDTLTITRAQEGTTALAFVVGDRVELRLTAATFLDALDETVLDDQQILGAVLYVTDVALKSVNEIAEAIGTSGSTDRAELYALMFTEVLGKIGVIGRAISGGGITLRAGTAAIPSLTSSTDAGTGLYFPANGQVAISTGGAQRLLIDSSGHHAAGADNTQTLGTASRRWSVVYAGTGTINTSDAREKTAVAPMTPDEIEAAKALSKEIGSFRFLQSIAEKGDKARTHIGFTVQRAIEIMESHGLDPFKYGFICYDSWDEVTVEHPAIEAVEEVLDENGNVVTPSIPAQNAWTEVVQTAGNIYAFRYDQLAMFLAAGFEARLSALES